MDRAHWTVVLVVLASGCGGDDPPDAGADGSVDAAVVGGATATYEVPATGSPALDDLPFPNDLFLGADGTFEVGPLERDVPFVTQMLADLGDRRGFCRSCSISFPIEGELDPASVPDDADGTAGPTDAIVLIRADGTGGFIPLDVDWSPIDDALIVRARYGHIMDPAAQYVAAVTDAIRGADGTPLAASQTFVGIRDGSGSGPEVDRARPILEPALDALAAAGVERARVVTAAVFTTDAGDWLLRQVRDVAQAAPAPVATVDRVYRAANGDLDELLGAPSEDRPGIDIVPADGVGSAAIVHDAMDLVVLGTYRTPRVVEGAGTEIGVRRTDERGTLVAGPEPEVVPYALVIPAGADVTALPVVVAHHGTPGTKQIALRLGNTFARMGMAILSFDAFQMGDRAASAVDERNTFRDLDGPDGFPEQSEAQTTLRLVGQNDVDARLARALGAISQRAVDSSMAVRFAREGDVGAVAAADPSLTGLAFDPDQVYWLGQSGGADAGMVSLPIIEGVQAAILGVGPPDALENVCVGPDNRVTFEPVLTAMLGLRGSFDGERRLRMHPILNLGRWMVEPLAPQNTIRYLLDEPIGTWEPPDLLFIYVEHDELIGVSGEHILGLADIPVHGTRYVIDLPELTAPVTANRATPNGTITAAGFIYDATHGLIRTKHAEVRWQDPFLPRHVPLDPPRSHENPIEAEHTQLRAFFESRMTTGRAEVIDPLGG